MNQTHSMKTFAVAVVAILGGALLAGCLGGDNGANTGLKTTCGGTSSGMSLAPAAGIPVPEVPENPKSLEELLREVAALQGGTGGIQLKIGTLFPMTGTLAAYGPDMRKAVDLAAEQINAVTGGGVQVTIIHEDDKTDPTQAAAAFDRLKNQGVTAIIGAAASSVTAAILDRAKTEKVIVITPASTSPALTEGRDNGGYFFRVPPSDALQGKVLADLVWGDGCKSASILAVNNAYGQGLSKVFEDTFKARGGTIAQKVMYEATGTTFTSQVQQAGQGNPNAVVLIGYPGEGVLIMKEAYQTGLMQKSVFFFSEGLYDQKFVDEGPKDGGKSVIAGLQGTTPKSAANNVTQEFIDAYKAKHNADEPGLFASESYDATWAVALATAFTGTPNAEQVKNNMVNVYNTPGENVSGKSNPSGLTRALAKSDINYVGASGDFNWDNKGDPTSGTYAYWKVGTDGKLVISREGIKPPA